MTASDRSRVFAICIDGYENTLGEAMMRDGELPALQRLKETSASFLLDHDPAVGRPAGIVPDVFGVSRAF